MHEYSVRVPAVEGLTGKHAIYLVVEGPEVEQPQQQQGPQRGRPQQPQRPQGLCDLHGLGFSKAGATFEWPQVPSVIITADGKTLRMPETPLFATNQNGLMEASTYQLYAPLTEGSTIQARSDNSDVTFYVTTVSAGRATVKATYKGKTKTYLIN